MEIKHMKYILVLKTFINIFFPFKEALFIFLQISKQDIWHNKQNIMVLKQLLDIYFYPLENKLNTTKTYDIISKIYWS
jgi:hypothetical protein